MTAELTSRSRPHIPAAGMVTGTVSDPGGYPLSGITVWIYDATGDAGALLGTTTTDDSGAYRLRAAPTDGADGWRVEVEDQTGAHVATSGASGTITMAVAGSIRGAVATKDGRAVIVTAEGPAVSVDVETSVGGTFRIGGLPAGTYSVEIDDRGRRQGAARVTVTAGRSMTLRTVALDCPSD